MIFLLPFEIQFNFSFLQVIRMLAEDNCVSFKCQLYIYGRYMIMFWVCFCPMIKIEFNIEFVKPKKKKPFMLTQSVSSYVDDDIIKLASSSSSSSSY